MNFTGNYRERENFLLPPECKICVRSADLAVAVDDVLVAAQLGQPHGAPGVELLGGNAHLTAKAKLAAIRKAGRAVDIDRGAVHRGGKLSGMGVVLGQNGLAVAGGVGGDMCNGFLHAVHDFNGQNVIKELGVKILRPGGHTDAG